MRIQFRKCDRKGSTNVAYKLHAYKDVLAITPQRRYFIIKQTKILAAVKNQNKIS